MEGCIKQWFAFVKPNFEKYVEPQRKVADVIVPRGIENHVAISKFLPNPLACLFLLRPWRYPGAVEAGRILKMSVMRLRGRCKPCRHGRTCHEICPAEAGGYLCIRAIK